MNTKRKETLYMLMALTGNTIFGFSFLFSRLALDITEPYVLLAVRFFTAFVVMSVVAATGLVPIRLKGKDIRPLIVLGILQPVAYFFCETYGILWTSSSFAGILIAIIPIAGLLFGWVLLGERPGTLQIFFSVLSVAGVLLMTVTGTVGGFQWKGIIVLLGAVVSGAMFSILSRSLVDRFSAFERTYVMFGVGFVVFFIVALFRTWGDLNAWITPITTPRFWVSIIYLACVSSVGAFLLLNKAVDVLPVARTLVFVNVTTVVSVAAGVIFLKESFSPVQLIGAVMIVIGVYCVNRFTGGAQSSDKKD